MINLLFCGNKKAFLGIYLAILSILKTTERELTVYIFTMDLRNIKDEYEPINTKQIKYLENILLSYSKNNKIILKDITGLFLEKMEKSVNINTVYTPYCLLRLFADITQDIPDKILYLDTDVLAYNDIKELYDINIDDYEYAGSKDYLGKFFLDFRYVNSGVLLLNMKKIKETGLFEKTRNSCINEKFAFPDQSALNLYSTSKKIISSKFNSQRFLTKKTVIRHFCKSIRLFPFFHIINVKPWDVEMVHKKLKIHNFDDVLNFYIENIADIKEL